MRKLLWLLRSPIRILSFFTKELREISRQPRLIASLILGPFLILLLFGAGYRDTPRPYRTLLVHPDSPEYQKIQNYMNRLQTEQLNMLGTMPDLNAALQQLRNGQADVVFAMPAKPFETLDSGQHVAITIYHNEIDPVQANYLQYFSNLYISVLNRVVVEDTLSQLQGTAGNYRAQINDVRTKLNQMDSALSSGDVSTAAKIANDLRSSMSLLKASLAPIAILGTQASADGSNPAQEVSTIDQSFTQLADLLSTSQTSAANERQQIQITRQQLDRIDATLSRIQQIPPDVMVEPFTAKTENVSGTHVGVTAYFAPGVVALLLQHLAVTVAALALVRERLLGSVELFRASPIAPIEILLGKFLSFTFVAVIVTAALLALLLAHVQVTIPGLNSTVSLGLAVPMSGSWQELILTVLLLDAASLGLGFLISALSATETQAVQLTMLVLLVSVFFSGFFISLNNFYQAILWVSYLLPVSYAIQLLQSIMLRGQPANPLFLAALAAQAVVFLAIAFLLFRRQLKRGAAA